MREFTTHSGSRNTAVIGSDAKRPLAILAPTSYAPPSSLLSMKSDFSAYGDLMEQMQRLRGSVYLEDGAISEQDLFDGRHVLDVDNESLHVLALESGRVMACCRFLAHGPDVTFEQLSVAHSPLTTDPLLGDLFRRSIQAQIDSARERDYLYVEVGGWALHPSIRHTTEAIRIALLNFSIGLALGGAVGIATATVRNHSADILARMGGRPLSISNCNMPRYYDPHYGCEMEILTFDSDFIPQRYADRILQLQADLSRTPVYCNEVYSVHASDDVAWTAGQMSVQAA